MLSDENAIQCRIESLYFIRSHQESINQRDIGNPFRLRVSFPFIHKKSKDIPTIELTCKSVVGYE